MSQSENGIARPRIDTSINITTLLTAGVLFGTILVGWTTNSEAVKNNRVDVNRLSLALDAVIAEQARQGNRLLIIENGIPYRIETVNQINRKLDELMQARGASAPDGGDR